MLKEFKIGDELIIPSGLGGIYNIEIISKKDDYFYCKILGENVPKWELVYSNKTLVDNVLKGEIVISNKDIINNHKTIHSSTKERPDDKGKVLILNAELLNIVEVIYSKDNDCFINNQGDILEFKNFIGYWKLAD